MTNELIDTQMAFTAAVAKALLGHRKAAGLASIRQNYKGTGSQRARRQLWINLKDGRAVDVWLDTTHFAIGGVTQLRAAGQFAYGDQSAADVATAIAGILRTL